MSKTHAAWQIQYSSFQGPAPSRDILGGTLPNSLSSNGTTGNNSKCRSRNGSTFTEEKKQRHGQVGHGRRLNSCFCRKAFKEIGRESNSTDDDDDAAVEVPAVEAPTSTSSTKKKALPAFALDFGNGA